MPMPARRPISTAAMSSAVPVDAAKPQAITQGDGIEWSPAAADDAHVAFISTGVRNPPVAAIASLDGRDRRDLMAGDVAADYPGKDFVVPHSVSFKAADGTVAHGQLFQSAGGGAKPGVIFVHGGPPRQMLLGWHYMDYYSNAYAMNQYLAAHGFVVLSGQLPARHRLRPRLPASRPRGSDGRERISGRRRPGAKFLQSTSGVDPSRIGIWAAPMAAT